MPRGGRFQGLGTILLQPYDEALAYTFEFEVASAADANDGAIPFGEILAATPNGSYCEIHKHPEKTDYTTEILGTVANTDTVVTIPMSYPYVSTLTAGDFIALSQVARSWRDMAAAPNGNVYACVAGGDIYMQTAGAGDFIALSQVARSWLGMAAAPNGNVYACVAGGDIYMQTASTGKLITDTIIDVGSTAGMVAGDRVGIVLDTGVIDWDIIASVTDATTFVITVGMAGAAAIGKKVFVPRIVKGKYHLTIVCYFSGGGDKEFNFNRVFVRDI